MVLGDVVTTVMKGWKIGRNVKIGTILKFRSLQRLACMWWSSSIRTSYEEQRYKKWEFLEEISSSYSRLQNESFHHKKYILDVNLSISPLVQDWVNVGESRHLDVGAGYTLDKMFFLWKNMNRGFQQSQYSQDI